MARGRGRVNGAGVVTVIQARTGSSRLPAKVLLPLGQSSVLEVMVERVCRARLVGEVVVATTVDPADNLIARRCSANGTPCLRGHPTDLIDRHYQVARHFAARHVVKIPSDCPLIDPAIIDRVIGQYLSAGGALDYVSNLHPESYPDGNDVEVFGAEALATAWRHAGRPYEREHTTPFLWDQPDRFRVGNVVWEGGGNLSRSHRYVLDYPEDYQVIRRVFEALHRASPWFGMAEIVGYLDQHPAVAALNGHRRGVNWYRHHQGELRTFGRAAVAPVCAPPVPSAR